MCKTEGNSSVNRIVNSTAEREEGAKSHTCSASVWNPWKFRMLKFCWKCRHPQSVAIVLCRDLKELVHLTPCPCCLQLLHADRFDSSKVWTQSQARCWKELRIQFTFTMSGAWKVFSKKKKSLDNITHQQYKCFLILRYFLVRSRLLERLVEGW